MPHTAVSLKASFLLFSYEVYESRNSNFMISLLSEEELWCYSLEKDQIGCKMLA